MTHDRRLQVYFEKLPELAQHVGRYALICDGEVSIHFTFQEAENAGSQKCGGRGDFLVRLIDVPSTNRRATLAPMVRHHHLADRLG